MVVIRIKHDPYSLRPTALLIVSLVILFCIGRGSANGAMPLTSDSEAPAGAGDVIVHGQSNGLIFGFEIDPFGTEGLLCEAVPNPDGTVSAAIETFDQTTGEIIRVLKSSHTQDDFVALGVAGSVGLIEREHVQGFNVRRSFEVISPLSGNKLTGAWTPPLDQQHIVNQVKAALDGSANAAIYALSVDLNANPLVFRSDLEANTFGPVIEITDPDFISEAPTVIAFDARRNRVFLGHDKPSAFILPPMIAFVDLETGEFHKRRGLGLGVINGIAIDSEDGILCTDTSFDSAVQFYNLNELTQISVFLPGANQQTSVASGGDIEFDSINKLFLVAQEFSGTAETGSSIQVYDLAGNLVESIDGLNFQGGFDVFPVHITLNPRQRIGFVNGPDLTTAIQSFSY